MASKEYYDVARKLDAADFALMEEKNEKYGESWKKRGGVGAFMMLARKWDRIEHQCAQRGYDVLAVADLLLDDIRDLRNYLLLVETEAALSSAEGVTKKLPTNARTTVVRCCYCDCTIALPSSGDLGHPDRCPVSSSCVCFAQERAVHSWVCPQHGSVSLRPHADRPGWWEARMVGHTTVWRQAA